MGDQRWDDGAFYIGVGLGIPFALFMVWLSEGVWFRWALMLVVAAIFVTWGMVLRVQVFREMHRPKGSGFQL